MNIYPNETRTDQEVGPVDNKFTRLTAAIARLDHVFCSLDELLGELTGQEVGGPHEGIVLLAAPADVLGSAPDAIDAHINKTNSLIHEIREQLFG
jgi:hypothetical protein